MLMNVNKIHVIDRQNVKILLEAIPVYAQMGKLEIHTEQDVEDLTNVSIIMIVQQLLYVCQENVTIHVKIQMLVELELCVRPQNIRLSVLVHSEQMEMPISDVLNLNVLNIQIVLQINHVSITNVKILVQFLEYAERMLTVDQNFICIHVHVALALLEILILVVPQSHIVQLKRTVHLGSNATVECVSVSILFHLIICATYLEFFNCKIHRIIVFLILILKIFFQLPVLATVNA